MLKFLRYPVTVYLWANISFFGCPSVSLQHMIFSRNIVIASCNRNPCLICIFFCVGSYIGPTVGMIVSGLLTDYCGWTYVFYAHGMHLRWASLCFAVYWTTNTAHGFKNNSSGGLRCQKLGHYWAALP